MVAVSNVTLQRRRNRRAARSAPRVQLMAIPTTTGATQRRRRQRRRRRNNRGGGNISGGSGKAHTFQFSKDGINGSSKGTITFGPSLSECKPLSDGILKAYHEYKITSILLQFISEASSTSSGSIAYELDPHCKYSEIQSLLNKFSITKSGSKRFPTKVINGLEWHDTSEDQFKVHYKGNGDSKIAGSFKISINVLTQNAK
uniref:Coat protein n=1 Tax=Soybean dwarf virus TaxID=12049 RepID=B6RNM8_9TOMB|nr:coat protein [Soybean dwarf virus]